MTYTSEIADAIGEVIAGDSVTVTKSGGISFTARRNRGEAVSDGMRDAGYLQDAELQLIATRSELDGEEYAPAVNDVLTVTDKAYVILTVRTDASFVFIRARREK